MDTLRELVVVAGLGVVASVLLSRWKVPLVAVLLLTGVIAGPAGLGLIHDLHRIELFAEVGVVFLLFSIGLEFSLERLAAIGRLVALGGSLQVGLTTALTALVLLPFGFTGAQGTFLGFAVALSSTAIVLRALAERGETDSPHGRFILGALIFQDLCVVPMMLLVPVLGGRGGARPPSTPCSRSARPPPSWWRRSPSPVGWCRGCSTWSTAPAAARCFSSPCW